MNKDTKANWFVMLFGVPFLGVGVFLSVMGWNMWSLYLESRSWDRVPAFVTQAELKESNGDEGGVSYWVQCRYSYAVNDKLHFGDRVGVENHGGSGDSYHCERYAILASHRDSKTPLEIWVDPADPVKAIAFREKTSTMYVLPMCGLVFGLPGLFLILSGFLAFFRIRMFADIDSPASQIAGKLAASVYGAIFVGVFWISMGSDKNAPLMLKIILGLLFLIPLGFFVSAIRLMFRK